MKKTMRAAGAALLGAAAVAVLASPAAAMQAGEDDCPWSKVCTWQGPEFQGDMTQADPDGQCHSGNFYSVANRSHSTVYVFADDSCMDHRETLQTGDARPFLPGGSWLAIY